MPKTEFHGILAVGRTKTDAVNNYRLLAMGKGAVAQMSGDKSISFVTHASHAEQMFNPRTGDMDLETDNKVLDTLEFASNSSADIEANHLVCQSGCQAHIVFDSETLVKYCPQCTAALAGESEGEDEEADDEGLEALDGDEDEDLGEAEASDDEESDEEGSEEDDEGSDDEGDESEESDEEDSSVVVSSSFEEALRVFSSHKQLSSLSSDEKVKAQYVVCSSEDCSVHILSDKVVDECPVCQSAVSEPSEDVTGEIDLSESEDLGDGIVPGDDAEGEEDAEEAEEGEAEEGEAEEGEAEEGEEAVAESADDEDESSEEDEDEESAEEGEGEEGEGEGEGEEDEGNALSVLDSDTEEVAADSDMDESASAEDLDVSYSSAIRGQASWTAYFKGVPVAMASKSSAGKNADIFDTPSFGHAALASAKAVGVKKALVELGFTPIKHKVSVSKEVRRLVDAQVAEQREALASELKSHQEKFLSALATAAIGINRGFFAEVKNPLKAALWNAMSSAGIRNPEAMIDNAFRAHSDAYHTVLFAQASDIVTKPAEVQESLAKTILGTNYQAVSSEQMGNSVEDRLAGMGTSVSTEQKPGAGAAVSTSSEVDTVGMQKIHRAVSSLGRRVR